MLIKDHQGDWAILKGSWLDFKRGVAGTTGMYMYVHVVTR